MKDTRVRDFDTGNSVEKLKTLMSSKMHEQFNL